MPSTEFEFHDDDAAASLLLNQGAGAIAFDYLVFVS